MDVWVAAALIVILASVVYSAWKQSGFSIVASVACAFVFALAIVAEQSVAGIRYELALTPHDIFDPSRLYTPLTSMFMHRDFTHLFVNLVMLVLIGVVFEQRIGTRPFMVLYLVTGVVGALTFAAVRWNEPGLAAVGASGAITGILGGFARLYPNEKMMLFLLPIPVSIWTVVLIFVLIQFLLLFGATDIAVEAHLGGLIAGVLLAPYVIRLPLGGHTKARSVRKISAAPPKKLATTPQLMSIYERIEREEVPDVRNAWIEDFLAKAKCPQCGSRLNVGTDPLVCEKGHII